MNWNIIYSANARQDIKDIYNYISTQLSAPYTATKQVQRILKRYVLLKICQCGINYTMMNHGTVRVCVSSPFVII